MRTHSLSVYLFIRYGYTRIILEVCVRDKIGAVSAPPHTDRSRRSAPSRLTPAGRLPAVTALVAWAAADML